MLQLGYMTPALLPWLWVRGGPYMCELLFIKATYTHSAYTPKADTPQSWEGRVHTSGEIRESGGRSPLQPEPAEHPPPILPKRAPGLRAPSPSGGRGPLLDFLFKP